jgi:GT2 family glycosyltransferase
MRNENNATPIDLRFANQQSLPANEATLVSTEAFAYTAEPSLAAGNIVSVVVATFDRPDDLRICLRALQAQQTAHQVEVIIVDNHPASGLTAPVVAEFPGFVLINEPRQGLAYARNAGFLASRGEIIVTTDDDVTTPPDWLETLVAPFAQPEVMVVTGNTLPLALETQAQQLFEAYGGLGRGAEAKQVSGEWFRSFRFQAVPTWRLGATANAAFRATIFSHPEIGLMDEALGPGMPSGVGEDTYLFYKVLKAGYTLVYEPNAVVWHKHRREMRALRRQIYDYSKGHVAYHLTTWLRDGDQRALFHVCCLLPPWRILQLGRLFWRQLRGDNPYSVSLLLLEMRGNLAGPMGLWLSRRRVAREGRSAAGRISAPSLVTRQPMRTASSETGSQ